MILITKTYISLIIPILIIIIFVIFVYIIPFALKSFKQLKKNKSINILKESDLKILVELSDCKFISNSYIDEKMNYGTSPVLKMLEQNLIDKTSNSKYINIDYSIVYFEYNDNGERKVYYSYPMEINYIFLTFLFEKQKQTYIYIDQDKPDNYYFDLEFLEYHD